MPIYEYRCPSCGFQKEHLQKMSDEPLSVCPSCGTTGYAKLLSAAGFQLKGSGWYATDFKGGGSAATSAATTTTASDAKSDTGSSSGGDAPAAASASATPCGGSCACH